MTLLLAGARLQSAPSQRSSSTTLAAPRLRTRARGSWGLDGCASGCSVGSGGGGGLRALAEGGGGVADEEAAVRELVTLASHRPLAPNWWCSLKV
eukprot:203317-Chlamydomonas_euryale.AAC.1